MGKNETVNSEALVHICLALNYNIRDIAEIVLPESQKLQGVNQAVKNNL